MSWTCPGCGRTFRHENHVHTCREFELEDHFRGSSESIRRLYDQLSRTIRALGEVDVRVLKSEIVFTHAATFAGVRVRKNRLELMFWLDHIDSDPPVVRFTDVSRSRVIHLVNIATPEDLTWRVEFLLQQAYDVISRGR